jgi:hypothetical protein
VTAGDVWRSFGRWRHKRPFWGCLFLVLAGLELFYTANASLAGMSIHLGPTGFLSYLLPLILIVCALLCLFSPTQRLFYGIVALLDALYSFIGLNLGGFFIGMLLGIVGGALVIAWGPPRVRPVVDPEQITDTDQIPAEEALSAPDSLSGSEEEEAPEPVEIAGHDDRPTEVRPAAHEPGFVPGFDDQEGPKSGPRLSRNPKALTVALIVIGLTAGMLAVGSRVPASAAADCPPGMPSRSVAASPSRTSAAADQAAAGSALSSAASAASGVSGASGASGKKKTSSGSSASKSGSSGSKSGSSASTPTPTPSPSKSGSGNGLVDGVKGIINGVGNLLGLGGGQSSTPSTSPTTSPTSTTAPTTTAPTTAPAEPTTDAPTTPPASSGGGATSDPAPSKAASSQPSASNDDIPCLGPRVLGLKTNAAGVPLIAAKPGKLETDLLTLYDSTYDGVVNLPTAGGGSARVLKFSMDKATNKPFKLTTDGPGGHQTVITSNELTTQGNVKFYTERLEGKLFGLIPVVFTPDSPPPLTLPLLWFTDVTITLDYVQCDVLTGIPLHIVQN